MTSVNNTVAIIDFGGQFTKVIDRRVRELCVNTQIFSCTLCKAKDVENFGGIILSGSPDSTTAEKITQDQRDIFNLSIPILGICYGMQMMNVIYGGTVGAKEIREDGQDKININLEHTKLFQNLKETEKVLLTHGDSVDKLGNGFCGTATSSKQIIVAIENLKLNRFGVQFHPEVDLTENGKKMFSNFLFEICKLQGDFTPEDREMLAIQEIQSTIGDKNVLVLVSGGVDSSVCAALVAKAIPHERIHCVHINNGFMRKKESEGVIEALKALGIQIHFVDASEIFYSSQLTKSKEQDENDEQLSLPLHSTIIPENKRKIIGDTFMKVAEEKIKELNLTVNETFLAQGTLRPDLIESAGFVSHSAATIKTHHNDTAMVRLLRDKGRIIEPLRDYHKDEVRLLGESLGLPHHLVWRQPFPGPGLAVRCLCSDGNSEIEDFEKLSVQLKNIDTGNYSTTILPIKSVGVQGDERSYGYVVALSTDYSSIEEIDWNFLFDLAKEIPKMVHKVNRIVFVFGSRIDDSPVLVPTLMKPDVIQKLQESDSIVNQILLENDLTQKISQMPVILVPVSFSTCGDHSIVLRPFITNDFMTGVCALPGTDALPFSVVNNILDQLKQVQDISRILFDLTCKPPGTTEWE